MRIDSAKWVHLPHTYGKTTQVETKPASSRQTDNINFGRSRARFEEPIQNPERLEKINALKAESMQGRIHGDAREIAKRFLQG